MSNSKSFLWMFFLILGFSCFIIIESEQNQVIVHEKIHQAIFKDFNVRSNITLLNQFGIITGGYTEPNEKDAEKLSLDEQETINLAQDQFHEIDYGRQIFYSEISWVLVLFFILWGLKNYYDLQEKERKEKVPNIRLKDMVKPCRC